MPLGLLGSSSTLGIGLAVYLDDQFTQGADKIHDTLAMLGRDVDDFSRGMRTLEGMGDFIAGIGEKIVRFGTKGAEEFATFEHSINATRVLAGLKKTDIGVQQLSDSAEQLSAIYGQLPEKIADAEFQLSKGGKSVEEINKMTEAVIALGAATQTDISSPTGTATMLLNILQTYNATADEALHYSDIITSASHHSALLVSDFFQSLRYAGAYASELNIPFEETAASIAAIGKAGLRGSQAGTSYANMLRYLETGIGIFATKKQKISLGLLGLSKKDMIDEQGHLITMSKLLSILRERTKTFSDNDKVNVLGGIFGIRGDKALLALLKGQDADSKGNLTSSYDAMVDKIHQDTLHDITRTTAKQMLDDSQGNWAKLMSGVSRFWIAIGKSLSTTFNPVIQFLTKLFNHLADFVEGPVGSWLMRWGIILGATLLPLGKILSGGARFAGFLINGAGNITNAFRMADVASLSIRDRLEAGAASIMRAAKAMGAEQMVSNFTHMGGNRYRDNITGRWVSKGAVVGEAEEAAVAGKGVGWIEKIFGASIEEGGWLFKTFGALKYFGSLLGTVAEYLFGWEALIVDLVSTLVTGKGIFEWIWDGLKGLFSIMFGIKFDDKKKGFTPAQTDEMRLRDANEQFRRSDSDRALDARFRAEHPYTPTVQAPFKIDLNLTVHPNNTGVPWHQKIELDQAKQLQSHSINF